MSAPPLLTKDAINVGGHKLPLPVVAAVVGVLGLVIVLRARSKSSSVVSAGTPETLPDLASAGVFGQDQSAQLANLSQQIGSLQSQLTALSTPAATTSAAPAPPPARPSAPPAPPPSFPLGQPPGFVNPDTGVFYGPRSIGGVPLPGALGKWPSIAK